MYIHVDMIGSEKKVQPKYINKSKLFLTERVAKSADDVVCELKCRTVLIMLFTRFFMSAGVLHHFSGPPNKTMNQR